MDGTGVAGGGVAVGVQGGHRDAEGGAGRGAGEYKGFYLEAGGARVNMQRELSNQWLDRGGKMVDARISTREVILDSLKFSVREFLYWFRLYNPGMYLYAIRCTEKPCP